MFMTKPLICAAASIAIMAALTTMAGAQTPATPAAAPAVPPALCTDRPTRANATCTVPEGYWQVEADAYNTTRNSSGGVDTEFNVFVSPTVKYGLGPRTDIELTFSPYVESRVEGPGFSDRLSGVSDVLLRLKHRIYEGETTTVALIPFVKLPTARRGIGNRELEGGVALPVAVTLPNSFTLTFGPEIDVLADADGSGRHVQVVNLINIGRPLNDRLTIYGELWTATNFDPSGHVTQASADIAAAYLVTPTVQVDAGANFGLNSETPDAQVYVGLSARF